MTHFFPPDKYVYVNAKGQFLTTDNGLFRWHSDPSRATIYDDKPSSPSVRSTNDLNKDLHNSSMLLSRNQVYWWH